MISDFYLDPPEYPEPPECPECHEGFGDWVTVYDASGDSGEMFQCDVCGHRWPIPPESDPEPKDCLIPGPEEELDLDRFRPDPPEHCPHGNAWGECGACDHEGDLAYDAARERRSFR